MAPKRNARIDSTVFHPFHGIGYIKDITDTQYNVAFVSDTAPKMVHTNEVRLVPYNKEDCVYINERLYKVSDIKVKSGEVYGQFTNIDYASDKIEKKMNDYSVRPLPKDLQTKMKRSRMIIDKYNRTVNTLNRKNTGSMASFTPITASFILSDLILKCRLKLNVMDDIIPMLRNTKEHSLEIFNMIKNPFDFIRPDAQLITFDKADYICNKYNIYIPFETKCKKWSYDLIRETQSFYVDAYRFWNYFRKYCDKNNQDSSAFIDVVNKTVIDKQIDGKLYKTTSFLYEMEKKMTDGIMSLFYDKKYQICKEKIVEYIQKFESKHGVVLSEQQNDAIINSVQNKIYIITGFPGTGKSTITACILFVLNEFHRQELPDNDVESSTLYVSDDESESDESADGMLYIKKNKYPVKNNICLLAPTGLAYVGIADKCGSNDNEENIHYNKLVSGTCHRTFYHTFNIIYQIHDAKKKRDEEKLAALEKTHAKLFDINPQMLVVDEFSMIDSFVMEKMLKWCKFFDARLIILGDQNQLPSIGPGCNLRNMIESEIIPTTNLTEIKRQTGTLVENIKKMTTKKLHRRDFVDDTMQLKEVTDFIHEDTINTYALDALIDENHLTMKNTKFLTYFQKETYIFNATRLNNVLQNRFNSDVGNLQKIEHNGNFQLNFEFRVGDCIIRTENDYTSDKIRANGEQAIIKWYDYNSKTVGIHYLEDNESDIINTSVDELYDDFKLAYALTVHKSQGSQYENLVIFIDKDQNIWDKAALYTAISRAKKKCIVITDYKTFKNIQLNERSTKEKISLFMRDSNIYDL